MKLDFVADTNFFIYVLEGNANVKPFLQYSFGLSFITEIELLGFPKLTRADELKLKSLVNDCFYIDYSSKIKEETINLKRLYNLKLADAIIAASSVIYEVPLVTADKAFNKINELDLILIEF